MTHPDAVAFGEERPEADVVEQLIPAAEGDEDTWQEAARITTARESEANEADLIEQAIAVPLSDDDLDFDR